MARLIDADKFLSYLIFSKHIDSLTCGEVKEAVEMCKVDVLDKIRDEIERMRSKDGGRWKIDGTYLNIDYVLEVIDKYKVESKQDVCKDCYYNDGEVHAECVICDKMESEDKE